MKYAALTSFPVARLDWADPSPVSTFIVKGTFDVDADGRALPASQHSPIDLEGATAADDGLPWDRVPRKVGADVLAVGSARSDAATQQIAVRVTTATFDVAVVAAAGAPTNQIPLTSYYVRRAEGDQGPIRLGASLPRVDSWAGRQLAPGFDFAQFNAAPEAHRVEAIPLGKKMLTAGLFDGKPRTTTLPAVAPCLFLVGPGGGGGVEVPLVCDTLVIDSDARTLVLTWRGTAPRPAAGTTAVAAIAPYNNPPTWADLAPRVSDASWHEMAGDAEDVPWTATDDDDDGDAIFDEHTSAPLDAIPTSAAVPFSPGPAKPPPPAASDDDLPFIGDDEDDDEPGTAIANLEAAKRQAMAALPFGGKGAPSAPAPPSAPARAASPAPAAGPVPATSPSSVASPAPAPADAASPWSTGTPSSPKPSSVPAPQGPRSALPRPSGPPTSARPTSALPRPAGATGGPAPLRGDGSLRETIGLDEYAAIKAALWQADASPAEVLARFSMTPSTWREHERAQARRVARDAADGGDLGKRIRTAIQGAQKRLEAERAQVTEESA